jgi:hypothetical protein
MTADPRALAELLEASQALQADALRPTHDGLDELVETGTPVTSGRADEDDHGAHEGRHVPLHLQHPPVRDGTIVVR